MKTSVMVVGLIVIVVAVGFLIESNHSSHQTPDVAIATSTEAAASTTQTVPSADYKNATYIIEGQSVTLVDGKSEVSAAPGSASMVTTQYFGNDAVGDLNGDGLPDVGFILTQNSGGSGTFYYAVAALKIANGYQGTNGVLLGDRISPQTTEIKNGQLVVNYADRAAGEPMTAQPSVGMTKYLAVSSTTLAVAQPVAGAGEHVAN